MSIIVLNKSDKARHPKVPTRLNPCLVFADSLTIKNPAHRKPSFSDGGSNHGKQATIRCRVETIIKTRLVDLFL
jgi:hypothetical protein